jgi:hypothetical protein
MRRFESVIDLRLLDRYQDEAIRVRIVDDAVAYAIRMFVEADLGHAHGWRGKYVVGYPKMTPVWWHEVWWMRFLRWFYCRWHRVVLSRLPHGKVRSWLVRRRIPLIQALKHLAFARELVIETRVYPIPDFDTLAERIIFQAADLRRRGEIPQCVVMGAETHYQLMNEMVGGMTKNASLYFGVSADMARVFLHTSPQEIIGLKIHISPFMAPGAVVVVGE